MDCREVARRLDHFTVHELQEALGFKSRGAARDRVMWMVSLGIVENTEHMTQGRRGRPATVYRYVPIPVTQTARRREVPPELEVVKKVIRADTVPGTGATLRSTSKSKNALLRKARRQGAKVEKARNGHIRITTPNGSVVWTAASPRADGVGIDRRKLRKAGLAA